MARLAPLRNAISGRSLLVRRMLIGAIIVLVLTLILALVFGAGLFVGGLLFLIGAFSMVYKRWRKGLPIGLEFVTMTTVIMSIAHGPIAGASFGFITAMAAQVVASDYDPGAFFYFTGEAIVGLVAGLLPFAPIVVMAISCVLIVACSQFVAILGSPEQKFSAAIYFITHLIINVGLWNYVGAGLLGLATG